ncbi:MAG: tetratricopeptide repeat protein [Tepidimonas ignava]
MAEQLEYADQIEAAWNGRLGLLEVVEHSERWLAGGRPALAVALYRTWLATPSRAPGGEHLIWFNLGALLAQLGDHEGSLDAYLQVVHRVPTFWQARINLGLVYERMGKTDAALGQWRHIVEKVDTTKDDQKQLAVTALNHIGRHLEGLKRYAEATAALTDSLRLNPLQPDAIHHWIFQRAKQCRWPVYDPPPGLTTEVLRANTSTLAMIALSDDPREQLEAAQRYVQSKLSPLPSERLAPTAAYGHGRLRIGYCSSDLCQHPVAMLTVELFELHDRSRFEVYVFDWSPEDGSALRARIRQAVDHFIDVKGLTDEEAARLIRANEIDILVDLQGQTHGARPRIFAWRPAPVQLTYLGLPATTGFPFIDYVIADRYLIPPEFASYYTEKPLYMPDVYQVSDRKREVAEIPRRQDCGLPERGVVLCCMNNNYKITPEIFDVWMRVLKLLPDAVLWLLEDNSQVPISLRQEAMARGVDPARLVFAKRTSHPQYLARYALADLFLDTYPFNAGTTANDALWMGLPLITISGKTFASRMAGALLQAAGLGDFIARDMREYESMIVHYASSAERLQKARDRLREIRSSVLFDVERWVKCYEETLANLVQ